MQATPFSLYIALEEGQRADLEVVAKAALRLSDAIKDAAFVLDPSLEVRIELVSGTESSLSLNSLIKSMSDSGLITKKRLKALAIALALWFTYNVADKLFDKVWEKLFDDPETSSLSDSEKEEIARIVLSAIERKVAEPHIQGVYSVLSEDPAIKGVGANTTPGKKPTDVVPREDFKSRSGIQELDNPPTKRHRDQSLRVTLISPVLRDGNRRWKFSGPEGEFGAYVRDDEFTNRLLSGQQSIPMVRGIEMDVFLRTHEEHVAGVWQVTEREILKVIKVHRPPKQTSLNLPAPRPKPPASNRRHNRSKKGKR